MPVSAFLQTGLVVDFINDTKDPSGVEVIDDEGYTTHEEAPKWQPALLKRFSSEKFHAVDGLVKKKKKQLQECYNESIARGYPRHQGLGRALTEEENDAVNKNFKIGMKRKEIQYGVQRAYKDPISEKDEDLTTPTQDKYIDEIYKHLSIDTSNVVTKKYNITITFLDLIKLLTTSWLNDTLINFFLKMVVERSEHNQSIKPDHNHTLLYVWSFNTFFYPKLKKSGYDDVKNWAKEKNCTGSIFSRDIIFVPLHIGDSHWAAGVVNFKKKRLEYYDSLYESELDNFRTSMLKYLEKEYERVIKDKLVDPTIEKFDFSEKSWQKCFTMPKRRSRGMPTIYTCPQQTNSCDCGEFACRFIEYLSRGAEFDFETDDMFYFRRRHALEIMQNKLFDI